MSFFRLPRHKNADLVFGCTLHFVGVQMHLFLISLFMLTYLPIQVPRNKKPVGSGSIISSATVVRVTGHAGLEREEESLTVVV